MKKNVRGGKLPAFLQAGLASFMLSAFVLGCATAGGGGQLNDPPLQMQIKVGPLKEAERNALKSQVCALEGVSDCQFTFDAKGSKLLFTYSGSLSKLRYQISNFKHPGLKPDAAKASLVFNGFDNLAPTIKPLQPKPEKVLTYKDVLFTVNIADKDVVSVKMDGKTAKRVRGADQETVVEEAAPVAPSKKKRRGKKRRGRKKAKKAPPTAPKKPQEKNLSGDYQLTLNLKEGNNAVEVVATDDVGNESKLVMTVTIDTTPPELEITMTPTGKQKAVIKGKVEKGAKVSIDGKKVSINFFGEFEMEVVGDPDRKDVTIIAVDEHGNETKQKRRIKDGKVVN
jgi:hypothetical protein